MADQLEKNAQLAGFNVTREGHAWTMESQTKWTSALADNTERYDDIELDVEGVFVAVFVDGVPHMAKAEPTGGAGRVSIETMHPLCVSAEAGRTVQLRVEAACMSAGAAPNSPATALRRVLIDGSFVVPEEEHRYGRCPGTTIVPETLSGHDALAFMSIAEEKDKSRVYISFSMSIGS